MSQQQTTQYHFIPLQDESFRNIWIDAFVSIVPELYMKNLPTILYRGENLHQEKPSRPRPVKFWTSIIEEA